MIGALLTACHAASNSPAWLVLGEFFRYPKAGVTLVIRAVPESAASVGVLMCILYGGPVCIDCNGVLPPSGACFCLQLCWFIFADGSMKTCLPFAPLPMVLVQSWLKWKHPPFFGRRVLECHFFVQI